MSPVTTSDVVIFTEVAHEIVLHPVDERTIPGIIVSSVPVSVIPEATTCPTIPPEYTCPLYDNCP